jgi:hypothetical protein
MEFHEPVVLPPREIALGIHWMVPGASLDVEELRKTLSRQSIESRRYTGFIILRGNLLTYSVPLVCKRATVISFCAVRGTK